MLVSAILSPTGVLVRSSTRVNHMLACLQMSRASTLLRFVYSVSSTYTAMCRPAYLCLENRNCDTPSRVRQSLEFEIKSMM